ncbi:M48 family metallopeptidase [Spirulina subsalsa FACHB-351]|uniref:M48 family metallopeptidase n=1 Tax=Spirulina subsalsa FACHB-351 TaxID=234711 RepID=A0ABT3LBS6_9CYAN|nr:SprT family zinc-dependent metalloprotease [Spirulina subsalsa]MCW6038969.1 M48 family metallopeptidase [Spirulina subsalsa FACHB-351]
MTISKSPTEYQVTIAEIPVQVIRKSIKNLHIGVYPPEGRVRVAAPFQLTDDNIRLAIISRLSWIKKQQTKFAAQPRQSKREMVSGESHYIFGKRYRLEVIERRGKHEVKIFNASRLQLFVNPGTSRDNRAQVLAQWYRQQLREIIPQLLNKWQPIIGENVTDWGIKKMRTKWGSCNITQRRIWLNLELAKKPIECLEYVVVHELVHLLERYHNDRFKAYMDEYLPPWRQYRDMLNREPLEDC